ncbi:GGDEF domain-containing protein [Magnetospirillum sp. SS-4]|uniref:GGDEF domain-containing protein n=1 Tax=Magnetospirillum sp. SS-4 TaxID=2681465 RepID=UPI00137F48B3|nr:GGDEF domain-containing protein [Magnetospirillum sp. SS-4]CAA7624662.1 Response regulator [Magnetospirillum sp. SS-4]
MPKGSRQPSSAETAFRDGLLDAIPFPIYVTDMNSLEIVSVNRAMHDKTGARPGEACHWAIYRQSSPCIFCKIHDLRGTKDSGAVVFEHFNDRDECWYQLHETVLTWLDGRPVKHSIAVDICRMKEAQNELSEAYALLALKSEELELLSVTDALTGLYNRRRLDQSLDYELGRAARYNVPLSVILLDVDRFKQINDAHGHQIGDKVLQVVADTMRKGFRTVDTIGRWGGEEFLILSPETNLEGGLALAEKLRGLIQGADYPGDVQATASFGVAEAFPGESVRNLVSRVDAALYRAKSLGRNRVET